jgi:hypothetical protein
VKKLAIALTAAAALTLAGCGNGGTTKDAQDTKESASPSAPAVTKADFLTKANAICKASEDKINAAAEGFSDAPDEAEMKAFMSDVALPETEKLVTELRALEAPEALETDFDAMLDSAEADLAKIKADWTYGMSDEAFTDADAKATAMGLAACGA